MARISRKKGISFEEHFNKILEVFIKFGKIQPTIIAVICWVIVVTGSLIHDFHRPAEFHLSDKRNILNLFFAKWCLAWSLSFLFPYVVLTSLMKSNNNLKVVAKNILRLVVAFVVWFSVTSVLEWIEGLTGNCEGSDFYSAKRECIREGLLWRGFDISGHSFLLTYCMLIISEEMQIVSIWTNKKLHSKWKQDFPVSRYAGNMLYICCCLLMMLWLFLLTLTAIYFHTVESKVIGVIMSILAWYLTYKVYFINKKYFPGAATGF